MELIRISDRKLKIMLTSTDMRRFELNNDDFGEGSAQTRRAFRLLLEEVKRQTGFDAEDHQISVQYFPSREGGCEMFLSQLSCTEEIPAHTTKAVQLRSKYRSGGFHKECAYQFADLDTLLLVCQRLCKMEYIGNSSAYLGANSRYYLFLTVFSNSPFTTPDELAFVV